MLCAPSALLADRPGQGLPGDALNRLLARRIDVEDEQRIRIAKRRSEIVNQIARARVPVRLEDHMNLAEPALFRGRQRCLDLRRMMTVIVDHGYARHPATQLKPAVDSAELVKSSSNRLNSDIQPNAYCHP